MNTDLVTTNKNSEIVYKKAYRQYSEGTRPVSFLTEGEVNAMAEVAAKMRDGERNELLILTTFQCALRISETLQITKQHRQIVDRKHRLFVLGKGHKPLCFPFLKRCLIVWVITLDVITLLIPIDYFPFLDKEHGRLLNSALRRPD